MNSAPVSLDIDSLRKDTPALCRNPELIHFNNAGAALMPEPVVSATSRYFSSETLLGGYETFDKYEDELESFYTNAAALLNSGSEEIAFIENATRAWDMVYYSLPLKAGDNIVTSQAEYASNYIAYLQTQKKLGVEIRVAPSHENGILDTGRLKSVIDSKTALIAITHIPTSAGLVNPAEAVGVVARELEIPYLLDACQSVGQFDLDVENIGCDFLSATGRKYLRGPRGTGFLYVNKKWLGNLEPVFLDLHAATWVAKDSYEVRDDARAFENWEQNFAGKFGLSKALEYANALGMREVEKRIRELSDYLRTGLQSMDVITVPDRGPNLCGIVTFMSNNLESREICRNLRENNVNLSASSVLGSRLDMEARDLPELVRLSIHYYNTEEEVDRCIELLSQL